MTDSQTAPPAAAFVRPAPNAARLANFALWPVAVVLVVHRVFILAFNGARTDDFTTVYSAVSRFAHGEPVYEQAYNHVDPLYLYNPGATLLLSPLGWVSNPEYARAAFIVTNAAAIIVALGILTKLVGRRLTNPLFPLSIALAFVTEAVQNTLIFSNINGILLLLLVGFLALLNLPQRHYLTPEQGQVHRTRHGRGAWWAGVLIGVAILIKPQFAPLLAIPVVTRQWQALVGGMVVPVALNAIAWPLTPGASDYLDKLVPYLGKVRDYANSSLPGFAEYFAMPRPLYWAIWLGAAAAVAAALLLLLRWKDTDRVMWALTTSGTILVGVFFLSSLGQQYYSMWLFPLIFTVMLPRSVMHSWPAWLAAVLTFAPLSWSSDIWPTTGKWLSFFANTLGWGLFIIVIVCTAAVWFRLLTSRRIIGRHEH